MNRNRPFILLLLVFITAGVNAQDVTNFSQFFINPYSINPSYAGIEGRPALFLGYRKQWIDIEGAPSTASFTFHAPTAFGLNYGLNVSNQANGVLKTSSALVTVGYSLNLDKHNFIRFALSGGAAFNNVDMAVFDDLADPDPIVEDLLAKNMYLIGNAGISFHLKSVHFGASLPTLFTPAYVSKDNFSVNEVKPFQSVIIHASNRFYFAKDKHVFEPYLLYRINQDLPSQLEAAAVVHLNHTLWFGGSYKQDFGISALGGVKLQHFLLIGGSYSLKNTGINELNSPTFEIQLSYIFGARKKDVPIYSFVNTVKEKEKRKTPAQLAAERKKAEEEKKKQQEALALKQQQEAEAKRKAEEARKQQEALALQQAEEKKKQEEAARLAQQTPPVQTPPVQTPPVQTPPAEVKRHDGGARLKTTMLELDAPTLYDTAHHEEQARISRLTEHASDPDEHHGEEPDAHPHAERHEFVKRGSHREELATGDYVIAAVFKSDANAEHFADGLAKLGFKADYGHLTEKNLWYVYISLSNDINIARADRDKYRKMKIFRDAWLLTVHH